MKKKLMCIQRLYSKVFFGLIVCITASCSNKGKAFEGIFGQKYIEAESYINSNKWIQDSLARYGVDPYLAISVIFPELVRYSAIKDLVETHSLEVLYTQYGSKYADFSIGRFQMKPSFAVHLENDWNLLPLNLPLKGTIKPFNISDDPQARMQRIMRLKDEKWQVRYLAMFFTIVNAKYKMSLSCSEQELSFIASAYNSGYWHDSTSIERMRKQNYFYTGLIKGNEVYNYSEISEYYYKKNCRK